MNSQVGSLIDWVRIAITCLRMPMCSLFPHSITCNSTTVRRHLLSFCRMWLVNNSHSFSEGATEYTTCAGLLTTSSSTWPQTALFQIIASGVPASKLVIGKPATTADANNGYIDPSTLAGCVSQAKNQGWSKFTFLSRRVQLLY